MDKILLEYVNTIAGYEVSEHDAMEFIQGLEDYEREICSDFLRQKQGASASTGEGRKVFDFA